MTLNRNVDNFFAETEQVAFHPGHVVPGIDFTNDPLLQGRLFSYIDTQLIRLGGPNFHEIPINRPVVPFYNNQREGYHRQTINVGKVSYHRNSLANNTPRPVSPAEGGYAHYQEKVEGKVIRARSKSFEDHFFQATLFWNSMSPAEKEHIINAFSFELGKVRSQSVKQQSVDMFANVNLELATTIAKRIGSSPPASGGSNVTKASPALSQQNTVFKPETRKVAVILTNGFPGQAVRFVLEQLENAGLVLDIISENQGEVMGTDGVRLQAGDTFQTAKSVQFDAVYIVNGSQTSQKFNRDAAYFMDEAFSHYKPIGATGEGIQFLTMNHLVGKPGVIAGNDMNSFPQDFITAIAHHRFWDRKIV